MSELKGDFMEIQGGIVKKVVPRRSGEVGVECRWCRLNWSHGSNLRAYRVAEGKCVDRWKIAGVESMRRAEDNFRTYSIILQEENITLNPNDIIILASPDANPEDIVRSSESIAKKLDSASLYAVISRSERSAESEVQVDGPYFGQVAANRKASNKIRESSDLTAQTAPINLDLNVGVIFYDGAPLIAVHYDIFHPNLLDYYAEKYLFERRRLTFASLDLIGIAINDVESFTRGNAPSGRR